MALMMPGEGGGGPACSIRTRIQAQSTDQCHVTSPVFAHFNHFITSFFDDNCTIARRRPLSKSFHFDDVSVAAFLAQRSPFTLEPANLFFDVAVASRLASVNH